jgi:hypothetical protein
MSAAQFRGLLARVPWFARLGEPHPRDDSVERIASWDQWGGPESGGAEPIGGEQSAWRDGLIETTPARSRARLERLWDEVTAEGFRAIDAVFREDLDGDPWHGPTNAAGHAAWLAATIACYRDRDRPIPGNALRQWAWFARGHWPCQYSEDDELRYDDGRPVIESLERAWLVVY